MRNTALTAVLVLVGLVSGALAAPLPDGGVTIQEIANVMRAQKLSLELTTDKDGDPLIKTTKDGVKFQVYFYECNSKPRCQSIQFYSGWSVKGISLEKINEWDRTKRFGRAYLDQDIEPCVEMDVDLEHGANTEAIANDLVRWLLVMKTFRTFIGQD